MTEMLFQKLEEKIVSLLTELDDVYQELGQVKRENELLRSEKSGSLKKLQNLVALLDSFDLSDEVEHEASQGFSLTSPVQMEDVMPS